MADLKSKLEVVVTKLAAQRAGCLNEAKKLAARNNNDDSEEAHYRGQALALKDAIRLIDKALKGS